MAEQLVDKFDLRDMQDMRTAQYCNNSTMHTDADSIRRHFGVSPFDADSYDYPNVYPNKIHHFHERPDGQAPIGMWEDEGGTDSLLIGKPGKGKSTALIHNSVRQMGANSEKIVWRGSTARSEWLPLAPWTRLCLPASSDVTAIAEPTHPDDDYIEVDLEKIVREVVYYDNPEQLNKELLKTGQFHVVYPDPELRGCQAIYEKSDKEYAELEFSATNPTKHWWFAWVLSRVETGPYDHTTLVLDEIGDIAPQDARADDHATYQKIELFQDCFVDARKKGLTVDMAGHDPSDIHDKIRKKLRWRITMPHRANPSRASQVVGFGAVPMNTDIMSTAKIGQMLVWTERNFELLSYPNYPAPFSHKLRLSFS